MGEGIDIRDTVRYDDCESDSVRGGMYRGRGSFRGRGEIRGMRGGYRG